MKGITYNRIVLYAILTELTLVVIQFAYLKIYSANYPGTELTFSEQYMKTRNPGILCISNFGFLLLCVDYLSAQW